VISVKTAIGKAISVAVPTVIVFLLLQGGAFAGDVSCKYCGMRKSLYGHSWMVIHPDKGSAHDFCSLHCAAIEMALHTEKTPTAILVADYYTCELIDADKAYWVIGGNKPGVMTSQAKWAFREEPAAKRFMTEHGGTPATFDTALRAALDDMYRDILMIQKRRDRVRQKKMESNAESP
jgi:nitrous oxide reductase accessory protein NosL